MNRKKNIKDNKYEQDLEENFDKIKSYSAKIKAQKLKVYKKAAKNYLTRK